MRVVIDSKGAGLGSSLNLEVSGFCIELADISVGEKVVLSEDSGRVSIKFVPFEKVVESVITEAESVSEPVITEPVSESVVTKVIAEPVLELLQNLEQAEPLNESIEEHFSELLFQRLVSLRKQISLEEKLPAYIIFHNDSLKEMASIFPLDLESMLVISGVGQIKLEKYGSKFLNVVKEYLSEVN